MKMNLGTLSILAMSILTSDGFRVNRQTPKCSCVDYKMCADEISQQDPHYEMWYDMNGVLWINPRSRICSDSLEVCCVNVRRPQKPQIRESKQTACGKRNADGIFFRIVEDGKNEAEFAEFPWMVAMLEKVTSGGEEAKIYDCGGALIHRNVVLTAAHCVSKKAPHKLIVRAGDWDTQTKHEPLPHQDRQVSQVIMHEDFLQDNLQNDVALLVTSEPFNFADNVQTVCLPRPEDVVTGNCVATGWGQNSYYEEGKYQVILKKVDLPIVERNKCLSELRKTDLGPTFELHPTFICAGGVEEKDTCKGDGGSPLVCPIKGKPNRYQQVGIVAWGVKCGGPTPAAYVDVAKLRRWIDRKMKQLNFKTDYDY